MGFGKILIAVDGSTHAARAAEVGMELAGLLHAEIAFVHSFDVEDIPGGMLSPDGGGDDADFYREEAQKLLRAFADRVKTPPTPFCFFENGKAAPRIVAVAKEWKADIIVMGTRGRNAIASVLIGSVAQQVLHRVPCPVLAVKD